VVESSLDSRRSSLDRRGTNVLSEVEGSANHKKVFMPIKHGALRQIRKTHKRTLRNKDVRSELKTFMKRMNSLIADHKRDEAFHLLPVVMRKLDQAATKRVIHKNTASRTKSRLMQRLAKSTPSASPTSGPAHTTASRAPQAPPAQAAPDRV